MFARIAFLLLPLSAAAQPCTPPVEKTIVLQLPGRAGLPAGSQMKIEVPVALVPESCAVTPEPPVDALRGPKPATGSVLHGEPEPLFRRPGVNDQTAGKDALP
jgi:hypothetical protein